jgi:hypothetical protein
MREWHPENIDILLLFSASLWLVVYLPCDAYTGFEARLLPAETTLVLAMGVTEDSYQTVYP